MKVDSMILLKEAPRARGGSPSRDFELGEASDGVLLVGELPSTVSLGLFIELFYLPKEHGTHVIDLFAVDIRGDGGWFLARKTVDIADVAESTWDQPLNLPLPFDVELEVDRDDLDLLLVAVVDDSPSALKNLFLRPDVPDPAQA